MLHMKGPIAIKIQLQQDPHNPHKGHSRNTECRWTKETVPLGPIGNLLYKATLIDRSNLIHKNKHKETAKMGR